MRIGGGVGGVRKRLSTIDRSGSFVDWDKVGAVAEDLEVQRKAIMELVLPTEDWGAFDLMWRLMGLAGGLYERCDDSNGELGRVFEEACADLGAIASKVTPVPDVLAERVLEALQDNGYGQYDGLVEAMAPALGESGLNRLKKLLRAWGETPMPKPPEMQRERVGYGSGGPIYADELAVRHRDRTISYTLKAIADLQSDVDGFAAQYSPEQRALPRVAAGIAVRLMEAGRHKEALAALDAVGDHPVYAMTEWSLVRLEVLEALGCREEAQALRWQRFEATLDPHFLREHLDRLPDFDDEAVERRALDYALAFADADTALAFFTQWNAAAKAAELVHSRGVDLDSRRYEVLAPAADLLRDTSPLAATVLWRKMIADTLDHSRSKRYGHAARHLQQCADAAPQIADMAGLPDHAAFVETLRAKHGRKRAFWSKADSPAA